MPVEPDYNYFQNIYDLKPIFPGKATATTGRRPAADKVFETLLTENGSRPIPRPAVPAGPPPPAMASFSFLDQEPVAAAGSENSVSAYGRQQKHADRAAAGMSGWRAYRDDQLLSNPGGDAYHLEQQMVVPAGKQPFMARIGKDLSDAAANIKNFFNNLLFGAKTHYRDQKNNIRQTTNKGLLGSAIDFFKDLGSALTLGAWRPDGEAAPASGGERLSFAWGKLKETFVGDLLGGVGGSINHLGEDLVLAGWNLVEVVTDATVGNFGDGQEVVSKIFDNGQVAIDYLTDIMPFGEAWLRVHAMDLKNRQAPIVYNLQLPENFKGDARWEFVRNTDFRKRIETIGALLADVVTLNMTGCLNLSSEKRN